MIRLFVFILTNQLRHHFLFVFHRSEDVDSKKVHTCSHSSATDGCRLCWTTWGDQLSAPVSVLSSSTCKLN
jgi:hypothetical protein